MGVAEAGNLKLDFVAKKHRNYYFFGLNTLLDFIEMPKSQKPCWPYGHFKRANTIIAYFHQYEIL